MPPDAEEIRIGDIRKGRDSVLRVSLKRFKGHDFIDVRQIMIGENGSEQLTKKGATCAPDKLGDLINLLMRAKAEAEARGLIVKQAA